MDIWSSGVSRFVVKHGPILLMQEIKYLRGMTVLSVAGLYLVRDR